KREFLALVDECRFALRTHERHAVDPVEGELEQFAQTFPALAELIRARFDRPHVVATRLEGELFNLGKIGVDKRAYEFFDINSLLSKHASGDLGSYGVLDPADEVREFIKWAPALASPNEKARLAIETGYGLITSEYSANVPGRGEVRVQVITLLDEMPETVVVWKHQ